MRPKVSARARFTAKQQSVLDVALHIAEESGFLDGFDAPPAPIPDDGEPGIAETPVCLTREERTDFSCRRRREQVSITDCLRCNTEAMSHLRHESPGFCCTQGFRQRATFASESRLTPKGLRFLAREHLAELGQGRDRLREACRAFLTELLMPKRNNAWPAESAPPVRLERPRAPAEGWRRRQQALLDWLATSGPGSIKGAFAMLVNAGFTFGAAPYATVANDFRVLRVTGRIVRQCRGHYVAVGADTKSGHRRAQE